MLIGFGISPSRVKVTGGAAAFDADAEAFFTAASITDATQKSAVNQLVLDLKSYNIWTKCLAIYPIVGGTASSHAVNLKTPGTYNLTFATGVTHSSTGMKGDGASGYADTNINPTTLLSTSDHHVSIYIRTNVAENSVDIGAATGNSPMQSIKIYSRHSLDRAYFISGNNSFPFISNTDSKGFYLLSKTSSTTHNGYRNSTKVLTNVGGTAGIPNINISILATNADAFAGGIQEYSSKQCAFSSIGNKLTDTEAANFYTAVQAYQTTLSRNV